MPILDRPNWEQVAQALARGESQRVAYIEGGFKYNSASAFRLCGKPEIKKRVIEIREERQKSDAQARQVAAEQSGVTLAWIELRQKYVVERAIRGEPVRDRDGKVRKDPETKQIIYKPDLQAANQGLITLGRMKGAFIDRTEIGGPGDFSRLTVEELDAKIAEMVQALGVPEKDAVRLLEYLGSAKEAAE